MKNRFKINKLFEIHFIYFSSIIKRLRVYLRIIFYNKFLLSKTKNIKNTFNN